MRKIFSLTLVLLFCSCAKNSVLTNPESGEDASGEKEYVFIPSVSGWSDSKSFLDAVDLDKIHDINALVFIVGNSGPVFLAEKSIYCTSVDKITLKLDPASNYRIFMIANAGKNIVNSLDDRVTLPQARKSVKLTIPSYYSASVTYDGLPMVCDLFVFSGGSSKIDFIFTRLYSRWKLGLDLSNSGFNNMRIKNVKIVNAPIAVFPLEEESHIEYLDDSGRVNRGDFATASDIAALERGESIFLYVLENVQGDLLSGNNNPNNKVPDYLDQTDIYKFYETNSLTFIEMAAEFDSPGKTWSNAVCRFFLGEDNCQDFSIRRNSTHDLTVHLSNNKLADKDWLLDLGSVTRTYNPCLNVLLEGYTNSYGCWGPRVSITCTDCEQLFRYSPDFIKGIGVSMRASGQHSAKIDYRNRYAWKEQNKVFTANGGTLSGSSSYHSAAYEEGVFREAYYSDECSIALYNYERVCTSYDRYESGKWIYEMSNSDRSYSPGSFIVLVKPDLCSSYSAYTEEHSYVGPPRYTFDWWWTPADYTSGNNFLELNIYVTIPEATVNLLKNAYNKTAVSFVKGSCTLANSFPYGASTFNALGYNGIRLFVNDTNVRTTRFQDPDIVSSKQGNRVAFCPL